MRFSLKKLLFAMALIATGIFGLTLAFSGFEQEHWGNSLLSASFFFGLVIVLAAISIAAGMISGKPRYGVYFFATMMGLYLFSFWTFPGRVLLWTVIHWCLTGKWGLE